MRTFWRCIQALSTLLAERKPNNPVKLTARAAREIRERFARGATVLELAQTYWVSDQAVKDVLNFETWVGAGGLRPGTTKDS